jgi:hypothetical protein
LRFNGSPPAIVPSWIIVRGNPNVIVPAYVIIHQYSKYYKQQLEENEQEYYNE